LQTPARLSLDGDELTILMSWGEALAEAFAAPTISLEAVIDDSEPNARWRATLGVPEPSVGLTEALDLMNQAARCVSSVSGTQPMDAVIAATSRLQSKRRLAAISHRVLRSALEQRHMRQARQRATRGNELQPTTASRGSGS
jgi:hypothetical protein